MHTLLDSVAGRLRPHYEMANLHDTCPRDSEAEFAQSISLFRSTARQHLWRTRLTKMNVEMGILLQHATHDYVQHPPATLTCANHPFLRTTLGIFTIIPLSSLLCAKFNDAASNSNSTSTASTCLSINLSIKRITIKLLAHLHKYICIYVVACALSSYWT